MTAKKVRCNLWKKCRSDDCLHYKSHPENPMCVPAYCEGGRGSAWCIPVKPRKPSPAKKLVQGKDFHGWAWKFKDRRIGYSDIYHSKPGFTLDRIGEWVRVKLTEVK